MRKAQDRTIYIVAGSDCMCEAGGRAKGGSGRNGGGGTSKFSKLGGRCSTPERERVGASVGREIPSGAFPSVTPDPACASVRLSARHSVWSETFFSFNFNPFPEMLLSHS